MQQLFKIGLTCSMRFLWLSKTFLINLCFVVMTEANTFASHCGSSTMTSSKAVFGSSTYTTVPTSCNNFNVFFNYVLISSNLIKFKCLKSSNIFKKNFRVEILNTIYLIKICWLMKVFGWRCLKVMLFLYWQFFFWFGTTYIFLFGLQKCLGWL